MVFNLLSNLRDEAVSRFHVDPYIFIIIYLLTILPCWFATFLIIRSVYRSYKNQIKEIKQIRLTALLSNADFVSSLIICILGLAAPYIYVIFWGENLPTWVYIVFIALVLLIPYQIYRKVRKGVMAKKFEYKVADDAETLEGLKLVNKRYCEKGYLPESEAGKPFEDKYIKHSLYIVAKSSDKVVGVIRIVENSDDGLPVLNEFEVDDRYLNKKQRTYVEIGNLAAEPGQGIASGLYKAAYRYCIKNIKIPLAAIGEDLMTKLIGKYWFSGIAYKQIGEPKFYIGGMCVPIMLKPKRIFLLFL